VRSALHERAIALRHDRVPFVAARVVLAERPTSAKPGDEAIVLPDGTIEGFVGGTCAESTVRAQSLALLDSGDSLLLRISPVEESPQSGKLTVVNPCLSGGTLEIFLEPVVPAPLVALHGDAPIGHALRRLGEALGYDMVDFWDAALDEAAAVVVASHGRDEEPVLTAALRLGGLDLGARTPEEVALSILAEIVSLRPRPSGRPVATDPPEERAATAIDPVCGMTVATVETSLHLDHGGVRHWFCGSGCLRAFASDPSAYVRT